MDGRVEGLLLRDEPRFDMHYSFMEDFEEFYSELQNASCANIACLFVSYDINSDLEIWFIFNSFFLILPRAIYWRERGISWPLFR